MSPQCLCLLKFEHRHRRRGMQRGSVLYMLSLFAVASLVASHTLIRVWVELARDAVACSRAAS